LEKTAENDPRPVRLDRVGVEQVPAEAKKRGGAARAMRAGRAVDLPYRGPVMFRFPAVSVTLLLEPTRA
jgi:hypothetical protein